jgi:hypothetical protein
MEETNPRPHGNSYWIEPGRLIAGEYPGRPGPAECMARVARHIDAGISFFLDLTEDWELAPYTEHLPSTHPRSGLPVVHKRMPVPNLDVPKKPADMTAILDCIDGALAQGHVVYVHCWGGRGRTGTVVGCYFVRRGCSGAEALERLAGLWKTVDKSKTKPASPETEQQRSFVLDWGAARTEFRSNGGR